MKILFSLFVLVLFLVNISYSYNDEDYWIQCEDNKSVQQWIEDDIDLDLVLIDGWAMVDKKCCQNCLYYKAWLINGLLCIEYKRVKGINT